MRLIASLTTLPSRINSIKPVLQSLINQTRKLDAIYLNIPYKTLKGSTYTIPPFIREISKQQQIKILRCKDYGPSTKLIPTINKRIISRNTYILTFDDDNIVDKDVVKIFSYKIRQYPDSALSFSGWCYGDYPFYFQLHDNNDTDTYVDWIQGCHCICYPSWLLDKGEILRFYKAQPKFLQRHDDHVISAYLESKKIYRISIKGNANSYFKETEYRLIDGISGNKDSLWAGIAFKWEVIRASMHYVRLGYYYQSDVSFSNNMLMLSMECLALSLLPKKLKLLGLILVLLLLRTTVKNIKSKFPSSKLATHKYLYN